MDDKKILILGGYGNTGRPLAQLLLQETSVELLLAGRNLAKLEALTSELNAQFTGRRVRGCQVDAADPKSLRRAFSGVDLVVVASSTAEYVQQVATAALQAGIDYLDVQFSTHKTAVLASMAAEIEEAGLCFITDAGFHPGLPAALVRCLAPYFDNLESAMVGSVIKIDWASLELSPSTMEEFVSEFMDFQTLVFRDGRWQKAGLMAMMKPIYMEFGPPFGRQYCIPMFLEEMWTIPQLYPNIKETGFFVGGFNWVVDWFISPIIMVALKIWPSRAKGPMGRLMFWGLKSFSKPPYGTLLKLEAQGQKGGQHQEMNLTISHEDGYQLTAIPVVACLLQYLDGSIHKSGLWLQANIVEPDRLLRDMQHMGIKVDRSSA
jgi:saccharopine dehydrogenase (NAD+, L-lysine-forming)